MFWLQFCLTIETFYSIWQPLKLWYDFALCFVYLIASCQDMIVKSAELHIPPTSLDFSGIGNLYYYFKAKNVKDQFLKLKLLSTRYKTNLIEPEKICLYIFNTSLIFLFFRFYFHEATFKCFAKKLVSGPHLYLIKLIRLMSVLHSFNVIWILFALSCDKLIR